MPAQYSFDNDLLQYMPDVLTHGEDKFDSDHIEAKRDIDNIIEVKWFKPRLRERFGRNIELLDGDIDFDPDLMLNAVTQLKKASAYRALSEYVLPKLANYESDDGDSFSRRAEVFEKRFEQELERVLSVGIDYDWDSSGLIDDDENKLPARSFRVRRG